MRLSEYAVGRDNNFTLLRFLAAMTVVLAHSFAAVGLPWGRDFLLDHFGRTWGEMALDMLFATSGFLVTASLLSRGDLNAYLWARALRLYPALLIMLPLTVFVLAPTLTSLSLADYFTSHQTWEYFTKCLTVITGVRYSLPGVFDTAPLKGEFNGSLWTLPVESRMYLYLAAGWLAFAFAPSIRVKALRILSPLAAAGFLAMLVRVRLSGADSYGPNVAIFMFLYGATLYLWRDRIPMSRGTFVALLAVLLLAAFSGSFAFVVYMICLPLLVLHLAYIPGGRIRSFNEWGDFSYGVYIYAFPVQQTLVVLFPKISLLAMTAGSGFISWAIAALSWNLIEKRALTLKDDCAALTSKVFGFGLAKINAVLGREAAPASPQSARSRTRAQRTSKQEQESEPRRNPFASGEETGI